MQKPSDCRRQRRNARPIEPLPSAQSWRRRDAPVLEFAPFCLFLFLTPGAVEREIANELAVTNYLLLENAVRICFSASGSASVAARQRVEGNYDPPASMAPDTERFKPAGRWPDDLIEQGWHNLKKAHAPLRLVCRYKDGKQETLLLPNGTDACVLKPGLIVNCK